jgi:alpha-tubulin suppressor-like RCC1 family protein
MTAHRRGGRALSRLLHHPAVLVGAVVAVLLGLTGVALATRGDDRPRAVAAVQETAPSHRPAPSSGAAATTRAPLPAAVPPMGSVKAAPKSTPPAAGATVTSSQVQVDGGGYHTCLRLRDGATYCWGQGAYGQLGTGTHFKGTPTRTKVPADAVEVQAGGRFGCALRSNGSVSCWGEDDHGQVGGPSTEQCGDSAIDSVCAPIPRQVSGLAGVVGLAAGDNHACALLRAGTVECWGSNEFGQLGGSSAADRQTPSVVAGVTGARQVVAGDDHSCALIGRPGTVRCWGDNDNDQTGGEGSRVTSPVAVGGLTDIVELVAGGEHTCARHAGGSISCWGYNYLGQLGVGSTRPTSTSSPVTVKGVADAVQLAAGRYSTCALRRGGTVSCWGLNRKGELGNGDTEDRSSPTAVSGIGDAQYLAAGKWHYCAVRGSGSVWCWGDNLGGQLGTGDVTSDPNPTPRAVHDLPTS